MRKNPFLPWGITLTLVCGLFFFFLYSFVSLTKHWHFQTGLDLAIYNQTLWFYSQFKLPQVTLYPTFGRLVWADHFTPSLLFLTPFYILFPRVETLLVLQSLFFTSGVLPLYLIAKEKTKNFFFSFSLIFSYLLFFGSQFALTFDFHAATFGAAFLPWIFYALEKGWWKSFFILIILALGVKEDMALVIISLGIFMFFKPAWRLRGMITCMIAILYFVAVIFFVIPAFSQGMVKEYVFVGWMNFLLAPVKLKTVFLSFFSFGFLPLLAPSTWIFPLVHFSYNFLGPQGRWDIFLHYRVALAPLLSYCSIYGVLNFAKLLKKYFSPNFTYRLSGGLLLFSILTLQYFLHLPLNSLSKRDFYREKLWMEDNNKLIKMVPPNMSVSTQNHLAPHLSGRGRLFYFPAKEDYVLLDLREDQPLVNFWASPPPEESREIIGEWIKKGEYQVVGKSGQAVLLKRHLK